MSTRNQREQAAKIVDGRLVRCKHCRAWIDLEFGRDPYTDHQGAAGTQGDPRSPGEHDDLCDVCQATTLEREVRRLEDLRKFAKSVIAIMKVHNAAED